MKKASFDRNDRFKSVDPEDMVVGKEYAFTINPQVQPAEGKIDKPAVYLNVGLSHLNMCLGKLAYSRLRLNLELSSTGRLHWHGIIIVDDLIGFYTMDIARLMKFGSFDIHEIKDFVEMEGCKNKYKTWNSYVFKQSKLWGDKYVNVNVPKKLTRLEKAKGKPDMDISQFLEVPEDDTI